MTSNYIAADTNILIYLHDSSDERKRNIAKDILAANAKIPAQVISEYINVTRRLLNLSKTDLLLQCAALFTGCEVLPVTPNTLTKAAELVQKHDFQIFDAIIIATCLEANCSILYSEDMQHGFKINNLTILNPFA